ncbi:hypothetical protein KM295_01295 [Natronomonas sp. F2-12]|jgi:hypothetical protein|uniref:DUF8113 domain-containing protein n=1 Tax=Natronomonas aquatica TaxID=2841590 RepID=A0A9R1CQR9_9EURY|nr:hypothetical protein [Natronomonas aquatica]MCQ4332142.1 hypothetical protein [Natronomonas aquatica]
MDDDSEADFEHERRKARELLDDDSITAFYLGVVRDGETADTTFAQTADDPEQEGLQALSLLATHVRIVASEAGVDPATVAGDAATLAGQMEELTPGELAETGTEGDERAE